MKNSVTQLPGPCCELGEGAYYDSTGNTAWWFDIDGKTLVEYNLSNETAHGHNLPKMASMIARIDDNHQLVAMEDGLYIRTISDTSLKLLQPLEADNPATRSNDGRVHTSGNLWIGTMGKLEEKEAGAIYWFNGNEVRLLYPDISIPNSICFSPDGKIGYFADTALNTVWRVNIDASTGLPTDKPEVFLKGTKQEDGGFFDGAITDSDGNFWSASWGGGAIHGFSPDGNCFQTIKIPAKQVTCPSFIGRDYNKMFVTTAWKKMSKEEKNSDRGAGYSYLIDGNFNGKAEPDFKLTE